MQVGLPAFRFDRNAVFYLGLLALLAFFVLAPHTAFASEGTGGSLPYESWLTNLRNSVTGAVEARPRDGHGIVLNSALHAND